MNDPNAKAQVKQQCWVGIDWGKSEHAITIADENQTLLKQFFIPADVKGFNVLLRQLKKHGPVLGVAIESTRNLIIPFLLKHGYPVYSINPKLSKNWRLSNSVSGAKSDQGDSKILAMELARRHKDLRRQEPQDPDAAELKAFCEKLRSLIGQRTSLTQRLRETLSQYHPVALAFFKDWTSPVAWAFAKRFSTPEKLASARKDTIIGFLKKNRVGLRPCWLKRIDSRKDARLWPSSPTQEADQALALATIAQLQALEPHIRKIDKIILKRWKKLPQSDLVLSLPGAGKRLAPALTAMVNTTTAKNGGHEALRRVAGVAPIKEASGKSCRVRKRRRCNKHWRNTLHLFAFCSTRCSKWAKAYYYLCRERGNSHATALRKLADKWLKILMAMIRTGRPYNEERYIQRLRNNNTLAYQELCG